jgi:tRNA threonylcarbamoyl adenosine modification protein YeaZ
VEVTGVWLAIDTATEIASVAAGRRAGEGAGPVQVEMGAHAQGARRHAAEILGLVDFVLGGLGIRPAELAGIVLGDGPGSFTGLRTGWAAAKGLAQEAGLDLAAVPSLMAAAAGAAVKLGAVPIAACFDALRGQVYGAIYVIHPARVETLVPPAVLTVPELARAAPVRPQLVVGDGAMKYADAVRAWTGAAPVPLEALPPGASVLLSLFTREGAARVITDLATAEPVYGRPAEAQVKWEARHGRPLPDPSHPGG